MPKWGRIALDIGVGEEVRGREHMYVPLVLVGMAYGRIHVARYMYERTKAVFLYTSTVDRTLRTYSTLYTV